MFICFMDLLYSIPVKGSGLIRFVGGQIKGRSSWLEVIFAFCLGPWRLLFLGRL